MKRSSWWLRALTVPVLMVLAAASANAQSPIAVSPSTVNVSSQGATTVFVTFRGLQGFTPDTIGSDIHAVSGNTPGMPYLPWVMSKFLNLGFSLEQVVAMATATPAKIIGRLDKLGTLAVGAPADVSILELVEGPVDFVDTRKNARKGNRHLKPVATVRAGRPFGRPYPSPFTYP